MAGGDELSGGQSLMSFQNQLPESPDVDGDGDVDEADFAAIRAILDGSNTTESSTADAEQTTSADSPGPTLAEPEPFDPAEPAPPLPPGAPSP